MRDVGSLQDFAQELKTASGSDFFSPIGTDRGFQLLNVPGVSGVDGPAFQAHVRSAIENSGLDARELKWGHADNEYLPADWQANPQGQDYLRVISATGRPDLQRRAEDVLATLGPAVSQFEDGFAAKYGLTVNRAGRLWEQPDFLAARQGAPDVSVPSPPQPWNQRPGPSSPGPLFPLASSAPLTPELPPLQAQTITP